MKIYDQNEKGKRAVKIVDMVNAISNMYLNCEMESWYSFI